MLQRIATVFTIILIGLMISISQLDVCCAALTLEGQLLELGEKINGNKPVAMTLRIYESEFGGDLLFEERQSVLVQNGKTVFIFEQGDVTTRESTSKQNAENLWVEVESDGQIMSPRLSLADIGTVDNLEGESLSLVKTSLRSSSESTLIIDNDGVSLGSLLNMGTQSISLGGVVRDTWPNSSGGGITNIIAGEGLNGGGNQEDVTLNVDVPLLLSSSNSEVIKGTSTFSGNYGYLGGYSYGVYGYSENLTGVHGSSDIGYGLVGISDSGPGVYGYSKSDCGISGGSATGYAGQFSGKTNITGGVLELSNSSGENWVKILRGTGQNAGFSFNENGVTDTQWIFPFFRGWQSDNLIIRDETSKIDVVTFEFGSGNVGIGMVPEVTLDVNGETRIHDKLIVGGSDGGFCWLCTNSGCAYGFDKTGENTFTLGSSEYCVYGMHINNGNWGYLGGSEYGVYGGGQGSFGYLGGQKYAVYGENYSSYGYLGGWNYGVYGYHESSTGVYGGSAGMSGVGVQGVNDTSGTSASLGTYSDGIIAFGRSDGTGYAGYFAGDVHVKGTLSKTAGSFRIDHPLDPTNKYLQHSFVESPDMMNIYNGNITLDDTGKAVVILPRWFEALNRDFRYQLTAIGAPAPNLYIADEVSGNSFIIAGGKPGTKISWQITGIRHDTYANSHRIKVELDKKKQK